MSDADTLARLVEWVLAHPELAIAIALVLLGGGDALREYRRTGRFPYRSLPWRAIRRVAYAARVRWFQYPKPDARTETVPIPIDDIRERLGRQGYEPAWLLSLHYSGEDLNCRRYVLDRDKEYPHRQIHIRGWDHDGETELYAHEEPSALHHPRVHLKSTDLTDCSTWVSAGIRHAADRLDPLEWYNQSDSEP